MRNFFGPDPYNDVYFQFMGASHLIVLFFALSLIFLTYIYRDFIKKHKRFFRIFLGVMLLVTHIVYKIWLIVNDLHDKNNFLPLHLSSISTIILGIVLIINNKKAFNLIYFWALTAGIQATCVPQLDHGYNHFRFYQFFLDHVLLSYCPIFMNIIYNYYPRYRNMWNSYIYLIIYGLFVMAIDFALEVNYMILREKPEIHTPLDYMGDWPYYVIFLIFAELGVFHVLYAPMLFIKRKIKKLNLLKIS